MNIKPAVVRPGLFRDRREAGRLLAAKLSGYANRPDLLVLALPRGGVPVAYEVARALGAPLDVFVVRKLGVPGYEELAMGAVATGGVRVLNEEIVERLSIPNHLIDAVTAHEQQELSRRERLYRGGRPLPRVRDRTVILVDDGSSDETAQIARDMGLELFVHNRNYGYGANQKTCYREALKAGADIVVMVHPDYQYDPTLLPEIIRPIQECKADVVLGSRLLGGHPIAQGMPWWKYAANRFLLGDLEIDELLEQRVGHLGLRHSTQQ